MTAELLVYPNATAAFVKEFCDRTAISIDFPLSDCVWKDAASRFAKYANRSRTGTGKGPRRLLADFLIGSHALVQADRLMTLDPERYKRDFPDLQLAGKK